MEHWFQQIVLISVERVCLNMNSHPYEIIDIKAFIDKPLVPIIKWMKKFDGIFTISCCQGDNISSRPRTTGYQHSAVWFKASKKGRLAVDESNNPILECAETPYILFYANNLVALEKFLQKLRLEKDINGTTHAYPAPVDVLIEADGVYHPHQDTLPFRFLLVWNHLGEVESFVHWLKEHGNYAD